MTLILSLLLACGLEEDDGDESAGLEDSQADDSGADDTAPACATVNSGDNWAWNGACPQMRTPCEIEVSGCEMAIAYSSGMTMGMPYAGAIEGDTITFEDGDYVDGCVGTVVAADEITGTCADGCEFTLRQR